MKKLFCDRCGIEVSPGSTLCHITSDIENMQIGTAAQDIDLDLCASCYVKVNEAIRMVLKT